jgi:hypothetical protein
MWAVLLGVVLALVAAATSHAALRPARAHVRVGAATSHAAPGYVARADGRLAYRAQTAR